MKSLYLYLAIIIGTLIFLGFKLYRQRKQKNQAYEEREDNVFYDAAKNIRRD